MSDTKEFARDEECLSACERLVAASYSLMDHGEMEACAALFADDAVWVRGGKPVAGREAILVALENRQNGVITRHLVTNIVVRQTATDAAQATALFLPLRGPANENGLGPAPEFTMAGDLDYRFVRRAGQWLIAHLHPRPVFRA